MRRPENYVDLEVLVKTSVDDEIVGHANTMRLHRMSRTVTIIPNISYTQSQKRDYERENSVRS